MDLGKLGEKDLKVLCHANVCTEQLISLRSLAASIALRYIRASCLVHKCEWHSSNDQAKKYQKMRNCCFSRFFLCTILCVFELCIFIYEASQW